MFDVADRTGASAHLGVLKGRDVVYLVRVPSQQPLISNIGVGSHLPSAEALEACYPARGAPELRRQVAADGERGFVAALSSYERGVVSVAAPVLDRDRRVVAAINVSAAPAILSLPEAERDAAPHVVATARSLSANLGLVE